GGLRAAIGREAPAADVAARVQSLQALFTRAEIALAPESASAASTFLGASAILLREGLEALLIVVAMITFLIRAERRELLRYVHGVWMHAKAQPGAWQRYVKEKLDRALSRGSAWLLFGLSFVAVYREVFETIIFYAAIGSHGDARGRAA